MRKRFAVVGIICAVGLTCAVGLVYLASRTNGLQEPPCPSSPPAGTRCSIGGIEFVAIPGGDFAMGDSSDLASPNEQPVHEVTLDGFWMATTELTFKQWNAFIAASGYPRGRSQAQSDDHPVVGITWEDAKAYADWFSKTYGVVVRLPSEAEWEYAARGGLRGRQYPNGDSMSPREANYASDGAVRVASLSAEWLRTVRHGGERLRMGRRLVRQGLLSRLAAHQSARSRDSGQRAPAEG